jgi:hypothetical protein
MSTTAIIRICGYVIGFGSLLTGQIVSAIISPYGASQNTVTHVLAIVGSVVTLATLIKGVIDTMTPQGYSSVITPNATTPIANPATIAQPTVLTTADAVKKGP